jgi:hypothetical protein
MVGYDLIQMQIKKMNDEWNTTHNDSLKNVYKTVNSES